uniref:Major sperm protein n=2 Tax=Parascaris univalens TaxID=6257 RepID=A0A915AWG9_PARUN
MSSNSSGQSHKHLATSSSRHPSVTSVILSTSNLEQRYQKEVQIPFKIVKNHPDNAQTRLVLYNVSNRRLFFRLRGEAGGTLSVLPSSCGNIAPGGRYLCTLTWIRAAGVKTWFDANSLHILLITRFLPIDRYPEQIMSTLFIASIVDGEFFHETDEPFVEKLSLDPQADSTERKTSPKRINVREKIGSKRIDSPKIFENFAENIIQQEIIDDIFTNFSEFYAHTSIFFIVIAIIVFLLVAYLSK